MIVAQHCVAGMPPRSVGSAFDPEIPNGDSIGARRAQSGAGESLLRPFPRTASQKM